MLVVCVVVFSMVCLMQHNFLFEIMYVYRRLWVDSDFSLADWSQTTKLFCMNWVNILSRDVMCFFESMYVVMSNIMPTNSPARPNLGSSCNHFSSTSEPCPTIESLYRSNDQSWELRNFTVAAFPLAQSGWKCWCIRRRQRGVEGVVDQLFSSMVYCRQNHDRRRHMDTKDDRRTNIVWCLNTIRCKHVVESKGQRECAVVSLHSRHGG